MREMWEKRTSSERIALFVRKAGSGRFVLQINKQVIDEPLEEILSIEGDINMAIWLHDCLQEIFAQYIDDARIPNEIRYGVGRRFQWLK